MTVNYHRVDGLGTVVCRSDSPRAVMLVRTPYDARSHLAEATQWAGRGITTVVQNVRGRYGSTGTFTPYVGEGTDGLRTIDWIAAQPWWVESPMLFLYGTSYGGHCAVVAAIAAEGEGFRSLGGVSAVVPALGLGETARNRDSAFFLESRHGWWTEHGDAAESRGAGGSSRVLGTLPVSDIGMRATPPISSWSTVIDARRSDSERADSVAALRCPLLAQGGTSDWFAQDTVDLWASWGGPSALALGPWDHSMRGSGRAERMSRWLNDVLNGHPWKGADVFGQPDGPVRLQSWPAATEATTLRGGVFDADPTRPFPSLAPLSDVRELLHRTDALVLPVERRPGPLVGTPTVRVRGADGGQHWGALLVARRADGRVEQLAHGMSTSTTIHLGPLSDRIDDGEELSLIISAHSFPRHARDLQTGEDHLRSTRTAVARRTVGSTVLALPS